MFENFLPWTVAEVRKAEETKGKALPTSLSRFLTTSGHGSLDGMRVVPVGDQNGMIGTICSLADMRRIGAGLAQDLPAVPSDLLVVAYGAGGELCVSLMDESYGTVVWIDEDRAESLGLFEGVHSSLTEFVYFVATDWDSFLSDLSNWQVV